jgi:hypothetical protein
VLLELAAWTGAAYLASRSGPDLLRRLVTPLAAFAALEGLFALYQALLSDARPAGTFLVPNHLALWLAAVLLLLLGRGVEGSRGERIQAWIFGPPVLAGIVVAGSRGAVVGLTTGGAWLLLVGGQRLSPRRRAALLAGAALLALVLGAALTVRMRGHDPFRYQRVRIWTASLTGFLEDPWWGAGPGQFEARSANQRFPDGDGPLQFDRAHKATHSDWLRLPAEFGAPAAMVLLVTLILAAVGLGRRRRAGRLPPGSDGAIAALVAILAHAAVDNPSRWPAVYLLAAVLCGALLVEREKTGMPSPSARASDRAVFAGRISVAVGLLLLFLIADVAPYLAWREIDRLPRGRLDERQLARLERALRLNRIHPDSWMRKAEHLEAGEPPAEAYAGAREASEHAVRLQPADARYRRALARIEGRACVTLVRSQACRERVQREYVRAAELSRYDPAIPLELAVFLLDLGDPLGARRAATRALTLEPEAVLPRMLLAEALLESGREAEAHRATELLDEAERKALRWTETLGEPHTRQLLEIDRGQLQRLRRKISNLSVADVGAEEDR